MHIFYARHGLIWVIEGGKLVEIPGWFIDAGPNGVRVREKPLGAFTRALVARAAGISRCDVDIRIL